MELKECLEENLRRELHRQHPSGFKSEADAIAALQCLVVKKRNKAVIRDQLSSLIQDKGEGVRRFFGRVKALANVCEYSVECHKCKEAVSYTDCMVKDCVITGLSNVSIKEDVMSHEGLEDWKVDNLIKFIEGKETSKVDAGARIKGGAVNANAVESGKHPKCTKCGAENHPGRCRASQ